MLNTEVAHIHVKICNLFCRNRLFSNTASRMNSQFLTPTWEGIHTAESAIPSLTQSYPISILKQCTLTVAIFANSYYYNFAKYDIS